ncbi:MAG: hypothetical protein ACRDGH_13455, partial [Candidatus Limnocylindria bacterium]
THDRVVEVTTAAGDPDRRHPLMDSGMGGAYDRFRAVHDTLGHARLGLGFDRDAEFAVWLWPERFHSPLARRALATELHGQHSVRWTTGEVAEPKAGLLHPGLLSRTRALGRARSDGSTPLPRWHAGEAGLSGKRSTISPPIKPTLARESASIAVSAGGSAPATSSPQ